MGLFSYNYTKLYADDSATSSKSNLNSLHDWVSAWNSLVPSIKQPNDCTVITDCESYNGCHQVQYSMEYSDEDEDDEDDTEIIQWESMKYFEDINHWRSLHIKQNTKLINMEGCPLVFMGDRIQSGWWQHLQITNKIHQRSVVYALTDDCIQDLGWRLFEENNIDPGIKSGWQSLLMCGTRNIVLYISMNDVINGEELDVILKEYDMLLYNIEQASRDIIESMHVAIVGLLPLTHDICKQNDKYHKWDRNNKYFLMINVINQYLLDYVERHSVNVKVGKKSKLLDYSFVDCTKYFLKDAKQEIVMDNFKNKFKFLTGDMNSKYMNKYFGLNEEGYNSYRCVCLTTKHLIYMVLNI